jgi:ankyrin repeat protein
MRREFLNVLPVQIKHLWFSEKNGEGETALVIDNFIKNLPLYNFLIDSCQEFIKQVNWTQSLQLLFNNLDFIPTDIIALLLDNHKSKVNEKINDVDDTLLHLAIRRHNLFTIQLLINKNAQLIKNTHGETPLDVAIEDRNKSAISILMKGFPDVVKQFTLVKQVEMWIRLGEIGFIQFNYISSLLDENRRIVDQPIDQYERGTLLHVAVEERNLAAINLLIIKNARLIENQKGETPLDMAIRCRYGFELLYLIEGFPAVSKELNPITQVVMWILNGVIGFIQFNYIVSLLDENEEIVNQPVGKFSFEDYTLLHLAAKYCNLVAIRLLINKNARLIENNRGETPLEVAINYKNTSAILILIDGFPNVVNHMTPTENVAMWIRCGDIGFIQFDYISSLLEVYGCSLINEPIDKYSEGTLLHLAVRERNLVAIKLLINNNARLIKNCNGETPLDVAKSKKINKSAILILIEGFPSALKQLKPIEKIEI